MFMSTEAGLERFFGEAQCLAGELESENNMAELPERFCNAADSVDCCGQCDWQGKIRCFEYAKILEDFICTAWMWPDLVCFGMDHGYGEADLENASQQLKKII